LTHWNGEVHPDPGSRMTPAWRLKLHLQWLHLPEQANGWWSTAEAGSAVLDAISRSDLALEFTHRGKASATRPKKLSKPPAGEPRLLRDLGLFVGSGRTGSKLMTGVWEDRLHVGLIVDQSNIDLPLGTLITRLTNLAGTLLGACPEGTTLGHEAEVQLLRPEVRRPRPPVYSPTWGAGHPVTIFDPDHPVREGTESAIEALVTGDLPAEATRTKLGRLTVLRWLDDLAEAESRLAIGERWFRSELGNDLEPGWTAEGDRDETPYDFSPRQGRASFYSASQRAAFRLVAPAGDTLDAKTLAELRSIAVDAQLSDGSTVDRLHLILPNRPAAIRLAGKIDGIDKVLFLSEDLRVWNPHPSGPWLPSLPARF
jgi:hypothetical protein